MKWSTRAIKRKSINVQ